MRLVFDTNALIGAARYPEGISGVTLQQCTRQRKKVFVSEHIINELNKALREDFKFTHQETKRVIFGLKGLLISIQPKIVFVEKITPADCIVLGTCLAAEADYLVTYDKDLLTLKKYRHTKIVRPEALRRLL